MASHVRSASTAKAGTNQRFTGYLPFAAFSPQASKTAGCLKLKGDFAESCLCGIERLAKDSSDVAF